MAESKDSLEFHKQTITVILGKCEFYITQVANNKDVYKLTELNSILNRVRKDYDKFEETHTLIEILDDPQHKEEHGKTRAKYEILYLKLESTILDLIDKISAVGNSSIKFKDEKSKEKSDFANANQLYPLHPITSIELPKFDGRFESWLNFRLVYNELVHENQTISPMVKFQYLRNCLKGGSAEHFTENLSASNENYTVVYDSLYAHYDNDTRLKFHHMHQLYSMQPISKNGNLCQEIQMFVAKFQKIYKSLESVKVPVDKWDLYLVHHICQLVDNESLRQIEIRKSAKEIPTVKDVLDILLERSRLLETLSEKRQNTKSDSRPNQSSFKNNSKKSQNFTSNETNQKCIYCKSSHLIFSCESFKSLSWPDKNNFVIQNKLCRKCFGNHFKNNCKAKNCRICGFPHHTILHSKKNSDSSNNQQKSNDVDSAQNKNIGVDQKTSQTNVTVSNSDNTNCFVTKSFQVLLPTAVVWIYTALKNRVPCRALIDSGAQSNFISEKLCRTLNLKRQNLRWTVCGIGENSCTSNYGVNVNISSRTSNYYRNIDCLVLPTITSSLPRRSFKCNLKNFSQLQLADPKFFDSNPIDLLLGAEIYSEIILNEKVQISAELPPFFSSKLGYIVCGKVDIPHNVENTNVFVCCDNEILSKSIQNFWQIENISTQNNFSLDEKACEKHFIENVQRDSEGRFIVGLPFKNNVSMLGDSRERALRQFFNLEKRLVNDPNLYKRYSDFLKEYKDLNHMSLSKQTSNESEFFLPHHPVFRESSSTTKLRVVFNASAVTSSGLSLNDVLLTGPTIQPDLMTLILNFRKFPIALTADIAKMYRQVRVRDEDQKYQQIFWREDVNDPIQVYQLNTVTYGMASAPFLAIRSLKQLAIDECDKYPEAARVLLDNFYVDDLICGSNTRLEAQKLKSDLCDLLNLGGFELRKWFSNDKSLVPNSGNDGESNVVTTLGVIWDSENDCFELPWNIEIEKSPLTKRSVLAQISRFFDPLGLAAPVIFSAKKFMQLLWSVPNLNWDDELDEKLALKWSSFLNELQCLKNINIPRCVIPIENPSCIELHGFGDASESGFGACIYLRVKIGTDWQCRLLCGKSKVAPIKKLTIPRLELIAALFLAQLYDKVRTSMNIKFSKLTLWTDSTITLYRINSTPSKYATFVANRVSQIQDICPPEYWSFISSKQNPADFVSRGLMPSDLIKTNMWWNGPSFLSESTELSSFNRDSVEIEDPELLKVKVSLNVVDENSPLYEKFDNYEELLRVYSHCLRFMNNIRPNSVSVLGELSVDELDNALKRLISSVQNDSFSDTIKNLKLGQIVKDKRIVKLNPFIDKDNLLRVGGRLVRSNLEIDQKHPYLLPSNNHFCKLLVKSIHLQNLHVGPNALMSFVRQRFWILSLKKLCKTVTFECIRCYRTKPKSIHQLMGQLPPERVEGFRVFDNVGIDFCGPFLVSSKVRSKVALKVCICLFVCFSTKACHLEVVEDLSTKTFLMALQRFVGRRSKCSNIFSDNGTNFVGAKSELKELSDLFNNEYHQSEILRFCTNQGINWKTIPARSPHFGGLWEANIKSAKYLLKRQLGNYRPNLDEFQTLVVQVEACLNSRPLTPMSEDPSDLSVLTPGHFLVGKPLNALPEPSLSHLDFNRLSRYQRMTHILNEFWSRWSREYLSALQERNKWLAPQSNIKIGSLVLLKEDNVPPLKWVMGRVTEVHEGADNLVRVVTVRTGTGVFRRAINKVCVLPIDQEFTSDNDNF